LWIINAAAVAAGASANGGTAMVEQRDQHQVRDPWQPQRLQSRRSEAGNASPLYGQVRLRCHLRCGLPTGPGIPPPNHPIPRPQPGTRPGTSALEIR